MRELYADIGALLNLTEIEENILLRDNGVERVRVLNKILSEGRLKLQDLTCISKYEIEDYNARYGTDYDIRDIDIYAERE